MPYWDHRFTSTGCEMVPRGEISPAGQYLALELLSVKPNLLRGAGQLFQSLGATTEKLGHLRSLIWFGEHVAFANWPV